jgi:hypothetical protein
MTDPSEKLEEKKIYENWQIERKIAQEKGRMDGRKAIKMTHLLEEFRIGRKTH